MEPITLILTALTFGATEMSKGILSEAGKDAYNSLKALLQKHFVGNEEAEHALTHHEKKPETYAKPLEEAIQQAKVEQDAEVLKQAKTLLAATDPAGTAQGKYNVSISGGQGNQVGDGNTQTNTYGTPPTTH